MSSADRTVEHVTCLGCGCACDDIAVVVKRDRIAEARNACPLGVAWFADGTTPREVRMGGRKVRLEQALGEAASLLRAAERPLVYLGTDVSCEAQREAVAIADGLGAMLDSVTATAAAGILAAQRRGRAGATLGELRQRADMIVFWGVDPGRRYPRFASRYAIEPRGLHTPEGRRSRTVIAVDVGPGRGPADADVRLVLAPADEVDALGAMRATLQGRGVDGPRLRAPVELARRLTQGRYIAIVADGERDPDAAPPDPDRAEALVTLAQTLNGPTRCALTLLRGGGNRSGADAVLTWQTGFPFAVDFAPGHPTYRPHAAAATLLAEGAIDAVLAIGAPESLPDAVMRGLGGLATVAVGPRASAAAFRPTVAVDTGIAGLHEGGTAFRMDDIPLPLRPALDDVPPAAGTLRALRERLEL
jgi:formylmethanofuran dehydrogenase subunit B